MTYLAQQPITVAILKDSNMHAIKDNYRFGVLYDGSKCADKVLKQVISMMADDDRLTMITVAQEEMELTSLQHKAMTLCDSRKHDHVILEG